MRSGPFTQILTKSSYLAKNRLIYKINRKPEEALALLIRLLCFSFALVTVVSGNVASNGPPFTILFLTKTYEMQLVNPSLMLHKFLFFRRLSAILPTVPRQPACARPIA